MLHCVRWETCKENMRETVIATCVVLARQILSSLFVSNQTRLDPTSHFKVKEKSRDFSTFFLYLDRQILGFSNFFRDFTHLYMFKYFQVF